MKKFTNHCLDRLTYGARVADIAEFNALGTNDDDRLAAWVDRQLNWSSVDDSAFEALIAPLDFHTLDKTLQEQWHDHHVMRVERNQPAREMEQLMVTRAIYSERQLLESLADFWHNHFSVFLYDHYAQSTFVSWDRDVIRPPVPGHPRRAGMQSGHMLGNFRKMLELSSQHVAMQYYLDNYINEQGNPNENYAREIMELHTLGAENYTPLGQPGDVPKTAIPLPWGNNGEDILVPVADRYVDEDVYSAMRMLTGWKIKHHSDRADSNREDTGAPFFYAPWHDPFQKTILGHAWGNYEPAPDDIHQFFDLLAYHPGTARHIAGKLCRRFISPNPPQSVIDDVAATFYAQRYAPDQLEQTCRTLFNHEAFKDPANWGTIIKRPMEALISAMRVCGTSLVFHPDASHSWFIGNYMGRAGHRPFYRRSPDGYPMAEEDWLGSNSLLYVMRGFDWLCDRDYWDQELAALPLMRITENASEAALPNHSPSNIASFWLRRILGYTPDGGWPGDPLHDAVLAFMRKNPNDFNTWPADQPFVDEDGNSMLNSNGWPLYIHDRIRGLVKLVLTTPQFLYR